MVQLLARDEEIIIDGENSSSGRGMQSVKAIGETICSVLFVHNFSSGVALDEVVRRDILLIRPDYLNQLHLEEKIRERDGHSMRCCNEMQAKLHVTLGNDVNS